MRLFPRFVMLLACLPLLLPPGLCACGASEVQAAPTRANTGAPTESPAPKCCGCRTHANTPAPAATATPPAPQEPQHAPACPATPGVEWSKFTERPAPVDDLTAIAFVVIFAHLPALAHPVRTGTTDARSTPPGTDVPSYLKHCALLY